MNKPKLNNDKPEATTVSSGRTVRFFSFSFPGSKTIGIGLVVRQVLTEAKLQAL